MTPGDCSAAGRFGAVAAGHKTTAEAAAGVLRDGGNAFDAAIAGLWMACVAEPILASPASGGFFMAHTAGGGGAELFDFFCQTPRRRRGGGAFDAITVDFGTATQTFHIGAGSAAVPGMVPGLFAVHGHLGQLPMPRLLAPAIKAARTGVRLTAFQARLSELVAPILLAQAGTATHFAPGGTFPAPGARLTNPALAQTLEELAEEGLRLFTHGRLAAAMCEPAGEGHLTPEDIASYKVARRPPIWLDYQGWQLALNPPPAAGGGLVGLTLHLAAKRARAGNLTENLAGALADVAAIRNPDCRNVAERLGWHDPASPPDQQRRRTSWRGTTHISVIDAHGNAAAATVSNGEGNGHMTGGFLINNMLGEDDINPGGLDRWVSDTRLSSMMAPTIMVKDRRIVALGSGGSNRIRSAVATVAARIAAGQNLDAAIAGPRLHVEGTHLDFEDHFNAAERAALITAFADHRAWTSPDMFFGGVHAVALAADGGISGAADPRRDGSALTL